jgi:hypothetical protein
MRPRLAALITSLLAALALGGWVIKRSIDAKKREHAAALSRAPREPGVLIPDPALSPGVIEVDLVPAGPEIALPMPATIRVGRQALPWSAGHPARFEEMAGRRDQRVSVLGEYLVEGAVFDVPHGGTGARVALRAIPIDPPSLGSPMEKYIEVSTTDPDAFVVWWKQSNIVIAESKVPRAGPRGALAAHLQKEWMMSGNHRDPSDRRRDRAVVRFEPGTHFNEIFPLVDEILTPKRPMMVAGESRAVPAFYVSVQPAPPSPARHPDLDMARPRGPTLFGR